MNNDAEIISFTWNCISLGIFHPGYDHIRIRLHGGGRDIELVSKEPAGIVRIDIGDLFADCHYHIEVIFPDGQRNMGFHTLPEPYGELKGCYAVIADPHISIATENRKGRLFVESAMILENVIADCHAHGVEFIMIGGDLTNNAEIREFETVSSILASAGIPTITTPGDHDIIGGRNRWERYIGQKFPKELDNNRYLVRALDTSGASIRDTDLDKLESMIYSPRLPLLISHMHLLPNPEIRYGHKSHGIGNPTATTQLLERLSRRSSIIYAGHQNVPSRLSLGRLHQIQLPQTCQYSCSWLLAREFDNGIYHTHIPIRSEILRRQSAIDSERAADFFKEEQWRIDYRRGKSPDMTNFIIGDLS